ncbi:MAG TPA: hypothetical protein PKE32_06830 [Miltoncostaeaceae bacterium]|nr:hypothetical protein [Miltoncostaeaceae bacterium]
MNTGSLTREHKLFIAAGANVLFLVSLFIDWYGASGFGVSFGAKGLDVVPSGWIFLIFAIVAALLFVAEALNFELPPPVNPIVWGTYLTSVTAIMTIAIFLEGSGGRKFGLILALIVSIVGTVAAVMAAADKGSARR